MEYLGMIYPDETRHAPGDAAERPPCWWGGILAAVVVALCVGGFAMLVWG